MQILRKLAKEARRIQRKRCLNFPQTILLSILTIKRRFNKPISGIETLIFTKYRCHRSNGFLCKFLLLQLFVLIISSFYLLKFITSRYSVYAFSTPLNFIWMHKNPHSNYHGEATLSIREISNDYWLAIDQEWSSVWTTKRRQRAVDLKEGKKTSQFFISSIMNIITIDQ